MAKKSEQRKKSWWLKEADRLDQIPEKDYSLWHAAYSLCLACFGAIHTTLMICQLIWMITWRVTALFLVPIGWVVYGCTKDKGGGQSL